MAKLSAAQQKQLDDLTALRDAPDEAEDDDEGQGDDDHGVIMIRGARADAFLASLLGTPKKAAPRKATPAPAGTPPAAGEGEGEGETETADPPPRRNRYFG